jgi:hypothetical protein
MTHVAHVSGTGLLPRVIVEALPDTDNIHQPAARAFANIIAIKFSTLSDVEVARLTDDEIVCLIDGLPEAEIDRFIEEKIYAFTILDYYYYFCVL